MGLSWFPDIATVATNDEEGRWGARAFLNCLLSTLKPQAGLPALFPARLRQSLSDCFSRAGVTELGEEARGSR